MNLSFVTMPGTLNFCQANPLKAPSCWDCSLVKTLLFTLAVAASYLFIHSHFYISSHNLFSTTAYFRPPKTLSYKNLDTLNFAAVGLSLFSEGTALLGSVFLLAVSWRPLDQRRIDTRLIMLYKITYDLVAIPLTDYLTPNRRQSKFIHPLAYRQISTTTNYCKYSFFPRTAVHWNALPISIVMLPTVAQFSHAVCQVVHVSP